MSKKPSVARTYNQDHVVRAHKPGQRRVSIYWAWSYPWEASRSVAHADNRFSTMTDVRRVTWPAYEGPEWSEANFLQGIAGTLELFHRSTLDFQRVVRETTGCPAAVYQRVDQAGFRLPIDERILADTDTLLLIGLDHLDAGFAAEKAEIEALRAWLAREGTCLLFAPHHDVGFTDDLAQRQVEYLHHRDALVPRQQRFSGYTRSLLKPLQIPIWNTYGLRPAVVKGTKDLAPLKRNEDLDELGLFRGVPTLNFHPHLPHYEVTTREKGVIHVLAQQPIDRERPHPFTEAGHHDLNACLWMPPKGKRSGHVVVVDSTHFTTLFGGTESLTRFWRNIASMPLDA